MLDAASTNGRPSAPATRPAGLAVALILAAIVGGFTVDGSFVADDVSAIARNPVVTGEVSVATAFARDFWGVARAWQEPIQSYRPLTPLAFRAVRGLFGAGPSPLRILALLAHVVAVFVAHRLLVSLRIAPVVAARAATLFAVHPALAELVGSLVALADLLAFIFGGLAVAAATRATSRRGALLVAALVLVACGFKESAFAFGVAAVVAAAVVGAKGARAVALTCGVVVVAVVALQLSLTRAVDPAYGTTLTTDAHGLPSLLLGLAFAARTAFVAFVPVGMAPRHSYAAWDLSFETLGAPALAGTFVLVGLVAVFFRASVRREAAPATLSWFVLATMALLSGWVVHVPNEVPERMMATVVLAACALVAYALERAPLREALRSGCFVAVCATFFVLRFEAQRPWHDTAALALHAVEVEPRSAELRVLAGLTEVSRGRVDQGAWHLVVASFVASHRPGPLPYERVERVERGAVEGRYLRAPELVDAPDRCRFVQTYLRVLRSHAVAAAPRAESVWALRYPACGAPGDRRGAPAGP